MDFNHYFNNEELEAVLNQWLQTYPNLVALHKIGESHEKRPLTLLVLTNQASGPDLEKPAVWLDLMSAGQYAVFLSDPETRVGMTSDGRWTGHDVPDSCLIFDSFDEAVEYCRSAVKERVRLRCEVFDSQGKAKPPVAIVPNMLVTASNNGIPARTSSAIPASVITTYNRHSILAVSRMRGVTLSIWGAGASSSTRAEMPEAPIRVRGTRATKSTPAAPRDMPRHDH